MALVYLALFLLVTQWAVDREMAALGDSALYAITLCVVLTSALLARWRTSVAGRSENRQVYFDEVPDPVVFTLNLHQDGATKMQ
jgi:hypothetical protein